MSSATSTAPSAPHWTNWPADAKLRLLATARNRIWLQEARPEQRPPDGDWLIWYLRGGRGAGKTRTGAETLAIWCFSHDPGDWMIVAPTFKDAKRCVEMPKSGLLAVLGGVRGPLVRDWNRSEGTVYLANGSEVHLDGANDGADRIQGYNLRGAWCDEIGLWEKWEKAWQEALRPAVRFAPSKIVATGTPKMGHGLVAKLLADPNVPCAHMRTIDNIANLSPSMVALIDEYQGTTLGRQELEGEFIEALEGSILSRMDWRWYTPTGGHVYASRVGAGLPDNLPPFERIVHSWDTALKDKTSSDYAAGQVWGCAGPDRYLLRLWHGHAGLNATIAAMGELRGWSGQRWPRVPTYVLVENTANGPDAITEMRKQVDGVVAVAAKGDKVQRALSAAVALETGHCHLPGEPDKTASGRGYGPGTPTEVQAFVEECAMFRGDMKHAHDDQVDAWSQMVNWTRRQSTARASFGHAKGETPRIPSLAITGRRQVRIRL